MQDILFGLVKRYVVDPPKTLNGSPRPKVRQLHTLNTLLAYSSMVSEFTLVKVKALACDGRSRCALRSRSRLDLALYKAVSGGPCMWRLLRCKKRSHNLIQRCRSSSCRQPFKATSLPPFSNVMSSGFLDACIQLVPRVLCVRAFVVARVYACVARAYVL